MSSAHRNIISARIVDIAIGDNRRDVDQKSVADLARSISAIGLQTPITARIDPDEQDYILVAGRHRLEAVRSLGHERIDCMLVEWDADEARRWEIAENLHRAELTVLQRDEQIAEWIRLTEAKLVVSDKLSETREGRPGVPAAVVKELGVNAKDAQRAEKVASLSEQAKAAARDAGLDNNRSALLRIASSKEPAAQVEAVRAIAERKRVLTDAESVEKQVQAIVSAWNRAGSEARDIFKAEYIDVPVMDARFG